MSRRMLETAKISQHRPLLTFVAKDGKIIAFNKGGTLMSLELFNLILWIPFLLVFLSIGIPFCLKGFKKGVFRALVSTGATVAAAIIGFLAAKLLAPLAVGAIVSFLPDFSSGANAAIAEILPMIIEGIVTGLLALIIFSVLLIILIPVSKILLALIPVPKGKGLVSRLLGLGLRFIDAVIVAILVLLPIYGSLAAFTPAVETVLTLTEQSSDPDEAPEAPTILDFVRCAAEHPVVSLTRCPPFSVVYNGLSSASTSLGTINVPEMVQTMTQTVDAFQSIMEGEFTAEDLDAFVKMQKDVVNTDWFYTVCSSAAESLKESMPEDMGEDTVFLAAIQDLIDRPKEEFQQCCSGVLDWLSSASEKGLFQVMEDGTLDAQWISQSGLLQKSVEVQSKMPEDFPFMDLISEFFADYMAETDENNLLTDTATDI